MNDTLHTSAEVARVLLPAAGEWTLAHVAGALEAIADWYLRHQGRPSLIDRPAVQKEVREMNMSTGSREGILAQLEPLAFECEWALPTFDREAAGFTFRVI
ncbi:hypothetical protein LGM85_22570 [Burkholderia multivorans]|uniref:hypothetical protein n=1 Tax=Burkholderia multivorans TaxID=87883 RepID=UPI00158B295A|nr:hypothetical protein [Burkholderia multivorans]MBU9371811.1 hypothetical protein [Burkholderia multivorans]MBY4672294.1 hypothetical protein [Burkholderia multivorans]MCA8486720.1 hypothetical protein [Burkholderia multivorans]MDR8877601.1 hypothetical protein [Burkholderia multivorans]MDR8883530.1 hypothetical protein [Burkholderia multivorans]